MSAVNAVALLAAAGGDYQISRSVRLRSSASAFLSRTPASAGNQQRWTWSGWAKRGSFGQQQLFTAGAGTGGSPECYIDFEDNLNFQIFDGTSNLAVVRSTAVYRDPSAWYHVVVSVDTTQATAANRVLLYINGQAITSFAFSTYPTQNLNTQVNAATAHRISSSTRINAYYFDGYLAEINFIDGQALTPSSFGQFDPVTGVWGAKKYTGTYGTNGFWLDFRNPSNTSSLGQDSAFIDGLKAQNNFWTTNNISVTAGVTYDSMIDVPTMYADGGNGRGNYPVLNPLFNTGSLGLMPLTNANLTATDSSGSAAWRSRWSTMGIASGKHYAEFTVAYSGSASVVTAGAIAIGLHDGGSATYVGQTSTTYGYFANAARYNNASSTAYGATYANGDVIGVAYDADAGTLTFYKNNVSQGVAYSSIPAGTYFFAASLYWVTPDGVTVIHANFGQRPFAYTPPTGFRALNTQNLPDSTIRAGNKFFDATTYAGTSGVLPVTNSGGFQPDLVWVKSRSGLGTNHALQDSLRGATAYLVSNLTIAENTNTSNNWFRSFDSNGFTVANQTTGGTVTNEWNSAGNTYIGWQWKESVSAGFDIVTYTGNGSAQTIAHSLGVAPKMYIVKSRGADDWVVYHANLTSAAFYLTLNTTNGQVSNNVVFNSTAPTSTVFSVGTSRSTASTGYVAYLFAEVAGFSRFGGYTGNGSADGPFVFCGFRPKFVLVKNTSAAGNWGLYDTSRSTFNAVPDVLYPNLSNAEGAWPAGTGIDFTSNGFKIRRGDADLNGSGNTLIFAAFAENPFKNSLAR